MSIASELVLASSVVVRHRHFGGGLFLIAALLIGGLVFMAVRASDRRRSTHGGEEPPWRQDGPPGSPPPGWRSPEGPAPSPPEGRTSVLVPPEAGGTAAPTSAGRAGEMRTDGVAGVSAAAAEASAPVVPPTETVAPTGRRRRTRPAPDGTWAVETHGLTKRFGANIAVDEVELLVPRGHAFGYLGPNGAGKTTLIRTLLGLTKADSGTMALLGVPVPGDRAKALSRVGAIVDEPRFFGHLSGRENLQILAAARGGSAGDRITPSLGRVGLADRADDKVRAYSMGMRQRLGVASCLLGDPELLILDEPMNGLDPAGMYEMRTMIESLVDEGRTVMLSSHLLDEVERTCDSVAIVDHGRVIRQGPIEELVRGAQASAVRVECSDPEGAAGVLQAAGLASGVAFDGKWLNVTLPAGAPREVVAEINRLLVSRGFSVYGLEEVRASLEDWFLSVTSRLGERQ